MKIITYCGIAFIYIFLFFSFSKAGAQQIFNSFNQWSKNNPIEKLYLHTDRSAYYAGQTIFMKSYFFNDLQADTKSTTVYIELLNSSAEIVVRRVFPVFAGISLGQMELTDDIASGNYLLRAYSPAMLNYPGFYFTKVITVVGTAPASPVSNSIQNNTADIVFFPEGGNLIEGLFNNIAFKVTDKNGTPLNVSGTLKDNTGEVISNISTVHDGMGMFSLIPLKGQSYFVTLNSNENVLYPLPGAHTKGVSFIVNTTGKGIVYRIGEQKNTAAEFSAAYIVGQMHNHLVFSRKLENNSNQINGIIPDGELPTGILQLTVFNKDYIPLAERLVYINNKEYKIEASVTKDSVNNLPFQRNRITLNLKDTIIGHFSVAITDADYETNPYRSSNILSYFLLSSDLKGYIHNPAYYFSSDSAHVKQALDLLMMTNGWRRFNWKDIAENKMPETKYHNDGYISINGTVLKESNQKPLALTNLVYMMKPVENTSTRYGQPKVIQTDSLGNFSIDSLIFSGTIQFSLSEILGSKSNYLQIQLKEDSLHRNFNPEPIPMEFLQNDKTGQLELIQEDYKKYSDSKGEILESVTVSARYKTEMEKLDENYTTGYFRGGAFAKTLDVRNEIGGNVFDFIRGRLPGVTVYRDEEEGGMMNYVVKLRQLNTEHWPNPPLQMYLNEMPTSSEFIESIPIEQIAYVKIFSSFTGAEGGRGAVAIYTKKGADDDYGLPSIVSSVNYRGYDIVKEFYSPEYDRAGFEKPESDNRLSLLWQPDMYIAAIGPYVPIVFYNNSRTKKFKIVIEGVTIDGRLLMLEQEF